MQPNDTVTIVAVTYNSAAHIRPFLESVQAQTYAHCELLILDNASTDETARILETEAPWAKVVHLPENIGYRRANSLGFRICTSALILICNDDVVLEPTCVAELVRAMEQNPEAAIICPLITLYDQPDVVNTVGNRLAITGFYSARGKGQAAVGFSQPSQLASVSGCCFLYRRNVYLEVGGFSGDFDGFASAWHASYEDVDLSYRVRAAGYDILFEPSAMLRHRYVQKPMSVGRFGSMVFGRALLVLRNFEVRTIVRLAALYTIAEVTLFCYAALKGPRYVLELLRVWKWTVVNATAIARMRKQVQATRCRPDRDLLPLLDTMFEIGPLGRSNPLVRTGAKLIAQTSQTYRECVLGGVGPAFPSKNTF